MRPRHYDRLVLIGLCWLYGRSEFPPPPYTNVHMSHVIRMGELGTGMNGGHQNHPRIVIWAGCRPRRIKLCRAGHLDALSTMQI